MKTRHFLAAVVLLASVVALAQTVTDQYKVILQPWNFKADVVMDQRLRVGGFPVSASTLYSDGGSNGAAIISFRAAYSVDHAFLDGGLCNTYTVTQSGARTGDACNVSGEKPLPTSLQQTCQFEAADGGTGAASRAVVTRCCNDVTSSCDPASMTYHILGISQ